MTPCACHREQDVGLGEVCGLVERIKFDRRLVALEGEGVGRSFGSQVVSSTETVFGPVKILHFAELGVAVVANYQRESELFLCWLLVGERRVELELDPRIGWIERDVA